MQRNKRKQKESTRKIALKKREKEKERRKKQELNQLLSEGQNPPSPPEGAGVENHVGPATTATPPGGDHHHDDPHYHDNQCELKNMNLLGKLFSYFTSTIITTFYVTVGFFYALYFVIKLGYFDDVRTENGLEFYAEKPHSKLKAILPTLKMPLNTLVNMGYLNVGLIIVAYTQKLLMSKKLNNSDAAMFFIFGWASFLYGHVQFWRIILQQHHEAVLDQWITLPIFAWTVAWSLHLYYGWSLLRNITIVALSTGSYCATWYSEFGFEATLGAHILCAVMYGIMMYCNTTSRKAGHAFYISVIACAGFIGLKMLDLELPKYHPIFLTVSGHFLSKICDFVQIYYVSQFFMHVNLALNKRNARAMGKSKMD